jgi:hypothetical protein
VTPPPTDLAPLPAAASPAGSGDQMVKLSPFEVTADQAKGYFTPSTTSGTRLNNNIGDIPNSVTVIDKQQLEDTNAQNINDIMLYEANSEGSHTFTPEAGFVESGGHMEDALAGSNDVQSVGAVGGPETNSTRLRGLGAPDSEVDDFFSIYRIPFDTYNVQQLEIDRGPNSLMFGSGSAAGIVNASSTEAQLDKLSGDASLQASSFGGFRETADLNIPLLRDKVAIYLAQEATSLGMQRQPSSDLTHRQFATVTIDPFKSHKTKIIVSAEFWQNYAQDENTLTPYDYVTPWLAAGKPVYNPNTDMITYLATGKTLGPYVNSTTSPNYVAGEPVGTAALSSITSPLFAPGIAYSANHVTEMYANGNFLYAYQAAQTIGNNGLSGGQVPTGYVYSPAGQVVRQSQLTNSTSLPIPGVGAVGAAGGYASYEQPGVSSLSIYNWQDGPNTLASDFNEYHARTYHFDLQQEIFNNDKWGSLNADLGFFRQEFRDLEDDVMNQHSPLALDVDTNSYLLNGAPNAYAGSSFLQDYQGDVFQRPETNQNWRGMLEYSLDLRDKVPDWLKWIGHHRLMAEASTHDDALQYLRFRTVVDGGDGSLESNLYQLNNQPAIPGNYTIGFNGNDPARWQYVSAPGSYALTQAPGLTGSPGYGSLESFNVTTYNYQSAQWVTSSLHQIALATTAGDSPFIEDVQDQKTYFWQSFFWNDRIVGSVGMNDDIVKNRTANPNPPNAIINGVATASSNNPGEVEYIGGIYNPAYKYVDTPWNPVTINGVLTSEGELGGNTYSEGFVIKPFQNWSGIDDAAASGNVLASVGRTLGFTFNKSDNFNPPAQAYTDLLGNPLPKPTGTEKDFGLEAATPDKKLFVRMTWFRSANENNETSVSNAITGRVLYVDANEFKNWATSVVEMRNGEDPTNPNFDNLTVEPLSLAEQNQVSALTGLPYSYGNANESPSGGYEDEAPTNTTSAGGYDLELTYNPLPNWTMKLTGGRQDSKISSVDPQAKAYLAVREPSWLAASAPDYPNVITNYLGAGTSSTAYFGNFWNSYGYDGNVGATAGPAGGPQTVATYFQNTVSIPLAVEEAAQGTNVPGESEYAFNYLTNYTITAGTFKGVGVGGALRWISSAVEGYYGNQAPSALNAAGQVAASNLSEPIYTPAMLHADAWISYAFKLPWDNGKIAAKVQLNVQDLTSNGYLQPIQYNLDGTPATYRIIPPRTFALTTSFHF